MPTDSRVDEGVRTMDDGAYDNGQPPVRGNAAPSFAAARPLPPKPQWRPPGSPGAGAAPSRLAETEPLAGLVVGEATAMVPRFTAAPRAAAPVEERASRFAASATSLDAWGDPSVAERPQARDPYADAHVDAPPPPAQSPRAGRPISLDFGTREDPYAASPGPLAPPPPTRFPARPAEPPRRAEEPVEVSRREPIDFFPDLAVEMEREDASRDAVPRVEGRPLSREALPAPQANVGRAPVDPYGSGDREVGTRGDTRPEPAHAAAPSFARPPVAERRAPEPQARLVPSEPSHRTPPADVGAVEPAPPQAPPVAREAQMPQRETATTASRAAEPSRPAAPPAPTVGSDGGGDELWVPPRPAILIEPIDAMVRQRSLSEHAFTDIDVRVDDPWRRGTYQAPMKRSKIFHMPQDFRESTAGLAAAIARSATDKGVIAYDGMRLRYMRFATPNGVWATVRRIASNVKSLEDLGIHPEVAQSMMGWHRQDGGGGIIIACGATGQGKTTTLAGLITTYMRKIGGKCYTVEEPVEYALDKEYVNDDGEITGRCFQTDVKEGDWAEPLRTSLRVRPDYIYLGEVLSPMVASEAIKAANTGHTVLTTVHGGSIGEAVGRLISLASASPDSGGREHVCYDFAYAMRAIVHQQLTQAGPVMEVLAPTIDSQVIGVRNVILDGNFAALSNGGWSQRYNPVPKEAPPPEPVAAAPPARRAFAR